MPWQIQKVKGKFRVRNTQTGEVHAKGTTEAKAEAQVRLLQGIKHGKWRPTGKKARGKS